MNWELKKKKTKTDIKKNETAKDKKRDRRVFLSFGVVQF